MCIFKEKYLVEYAPQLSIIFKIIIKKIFLKSFVLINFYIKHFYAVYH